MNKQRAVRAVWAVTKHIPPGARYPNRVRRAVLPNLSPERVPFRDAPLVRDKTHAREEFIGVTHDSLADCERALHDMGYRRNLLSTLKYRDTQSGRSWEVASWVRHDGESQHHVYVFRAERVLSVYGHRETSFLHDAAGHEGHGDDPHYAPGDPESRLTPLLE
jgi:hypothetical protein